MNILSGYIIREVLKGSLAALILLLTLFNLFTFSDELQDLGKGHYQLKEILLYLALTSPRVMYELIPSAALLGSLFVIGAMGNHREIIAMRASGLSIFWVIRSVMMAGVILVIFSLLIGELVAPKTEAAAQLIKSKALHNEITIHSRYGLWLREGHRFINVRKIVKKGTLADIYSYELNDQNHLQLVRHIQSAQFIGHELWHLTGIVQTEITPNQILSKRIEKMDWKTSIDPDLLKVVVVKSDNMALYDLFMYIRFLKQNNQKSQSYELAFWSRLINPFVTFVMLMISIPFVFSVQRGVGAGSRIMMGIIIGMSFNIFDKIAGHIGLVYGFSPMLMAILPSILVMTAALYVVNRVH